MAAQTVRHAARLSACSNPDMLHNSFLGPSEQWLKIYRSLKWLIVDEMQKYRGYFGSNVAGGNVDCGVRRLLDPREEARKCLARRVGYASLRIPGVQMTHRRPRFRRGKSLPGDLVGRHRQVGRHGRCMNRASHRACDRDIPCPGRSAPPR